MIESYVSSNQVQGQTNPQYSFREKKIAFCACSNMFVCRTVEHVMYKLESKLNVNRN